MENKDLNKHFSLDSNLKVAVIGLGYVGLPLALAFSEKYNVVGFDLSSNRIDELNNKFDRNNEININELDNKKIKFTSKKDDLENANIFN